jgi:hypothetical protein
VPQDVEVDAIAIVDGKVFLVEAKSSDGLSEGEMRKLALAAERIRPDQILLAGADSDLASPERAAERLKSMLPQGTQIEVNTLRPQALDNCPLLPR